MWPRIKQVPQGAWTELLATELLATKPSSETTSASTGSLCSIPISSALHVPIAPGSSRKHPPNISLAVPAADLAGQSVPSAFLNPALGLPALLCRVISQTQRSQISFSYLSNPPGEWSSRGRYSTKLSLCHLLAGWAPPPTLCPKFQLPAQDYTAVPRDSTHTAFFSNRDFLVLALQPAITASLLMSALLFPYSTLHGKTGMGLCLHQKKSTGWDCAPGLWARLPAGAAAVGLQVLHGKFWTLVPTQALLVSVDAQKLPGSSSPGQLPPSLPSSETPNAAPAQGSRAA